MAGPPQGIKPSALVARLLAEGTVPNATVDFPRRNAQGEPICKVYIRLLDQVEEDCALANAAQYVDRMLKDGKNLPWKAEELEHNARCAEILAEACRNPDDPERKFFEVGVAETRLFTTDELSQLMLVYASLKEQAWPALRRMDPEEFEAWVQIISEGAMAYPFSQFSRAKLEAFADLSVKSLGDARAALKTETASSGSG
jgi:hypothetical protein